MKLKKATSLLNNHSKSEEILLIKSRKFISYILPSYFIERIKQLESILLNWLCIFFWGAVYGFLLNWLLTYFWFLFAIYRTNFFLYFNTALILYSKSCFFLFLIWNQRPFVLWRQYMYKTILLFEALFKSLYKGIHLCRFYLFFCDISPFFTIFFLALDTSILLSLLYYKLSQLIKTLFVAWLLIKPFTSWLLKSKICSQTLITLMKVLRLRVL